MQPNRSREWLTTGSWSLDCELTKLWSTSRTQAMWRKDKGTRCWCCWLLCKFQDNRKRLLKLGHLVWPRRQKRRRPHEGQNPTRVQQQAIGSMISASAVVVDCSIGYKWAEKMQVRIASYILMSRCSDRCWLQRRYWLYADRQEHGIGFVLLTVVGCLWMSVCVCEVSVAPPLQPVSVVMLLIVVFEWYPEL